MEASIPAERGTGRARPGRRRSPPSPLARAALLILALASVACFVACSPVRTIEAARLLADIARLQPAEPVQREAVAYAGVEGPRHAHLYRPEEPRAALVVVPGAAEAGLEDPRLIGFADALRRRGFLVLVPKLAGDDPLQVSAADAEPVADAVRYLAGSAGFDEVGLVALSYAVGPTILAALEQDVRREVDFILAIGGYHDIIAGITFISTGAFRAGREAPWRTAPVNARAKWLFLRANAGRVEDPDDAVRLEAIARRRLADPDAETGRLAAQLGPEGRSVYRLLVNRDPDRVPALVAALPERLRSDIMALDLSRRDLERLEAELILIHGRGDPMVPFTESVNLARAAPEGAASLYLLGGLDHVNFGALGPQDVATLLRAAYRLLTERHPAAPAAAPALP